MILPASAVTKPARHMTLPDINVWRCKSPVRVRFRTLMEALNETKMTSFHRDARSNRNLAYLGGYSDGVSR